ncbi:MAG: glycogen debranching enzyme alpha-1,6-glucosidase [Harvfovirus sp.]|uniref:Glycogen debranching enzyme alpha-1,6-glucosidase n=1 Tax=Harvfovirus sp. TaxID=2487768 RepID=A0A3G5A2U3_9VIRU|nr:MAG: glycogen debranching enzyme alpha-1,6-glucosidase [Harvfovirus sp.]
MASGKTAAALDIVRRCIGEKGIWASTDRYADTCWNRDAALTVIPWLLEAHNQPSEEKKIPSTNIDIVVKHLLGIQQRQLENGKVPILFLDNVERFVTKKKEKAIRTGKPSFMLTRHEEGSLENLTPHTRDGELLHILAVNQLLQLVPNIACAKVLKDSADKALSYVENTLLAKSPLVMGADWRDTREDLNDKCVLTNAVLLKQVYTVLHMKEKEQKIHAILKTFWNGTYFNDYEGNSSFDVLGNALSILYDVATTDQMELIFTHAIGLTTPYGIKMTEVFLPALSGKEEEIMTRDQAVIWPFVTGFMLLAIVQKGNKMWVEIATKEFAKWCALDGFFEWYAISTGEGFGSIEQVWSAAMFLRLNHALLLKTPTTTTA